MKKLHIVWAALLVVIALSYMFAEQNSGSALIVLLSALKFLFISWFFIEVSAAHPLWKTIVVGFVTSFSGAMLILY